MGASGDDEQGETFGIDVDELQEVELRIIAEKVWELLKRDLRVDGERQGLGERWSGWRQS